MVLAGRVRGRRLVVYADEARRGELTRFNMLRQQERIPDGKPNLSLADFIADRSAPVVDYVGAFAVTAGIGRTNWRGDSRVRRTTTAPFSSRPSPIGSQRRSPRICTRGLAMNGAAMSG